MSRNGHHPVGCIAQVVEHTLLVIRIGRFGLPLDNACSEWLRENFVEKLLNRVIMTANQSPALPWWLALVREAYFPILRIPLIRGRPYWSMLRSPR
jgi:hypothetical protein